MRNAPVPQIVAVISSRADLGRAARLRNPPDFFELRLDAAAGRIREVQDALDRLNAPLIITARHPQEGGLNELAAPERRELLRQFLPHAACVDIELRSAGPLRAVLEEARARNVRTIISYHNFDDTPTATRLDEIARAIQSLGADVLKIATRTDTPDQFARLAAFFERHRGKVKISAMGMGRLGRISRLEFLRRGSALNYAHLGTPQTAGQLSVAQLRRALKTRS
jgi:3-dehydroquinate dehydratase-1